MHKRGPGKKRLGWALVWALAGCVEPAPRPAQPPPKLSKTILVKGDPRTFVKGTKQNGNHALPASMFKEGDRWYFFPVIHIEEQRDLEPGDTEEESDTSPEPTMTLAQALELGAYTVKIGPTKTNSVELPDVTLEVTTPDGDLSRIFFSPVDATQVRFSAVANNDEKANMDTEHFEVLHVSVTPDAEALSIMVYSKLNKPSLYVWRFSKADNILDFQPVEGEFNYLLGPGVKTAWNANRPVTVTLCGNESSALVEIVERATNRWRELLEYRLRVDFTKRSECPPFSDLNVNTIQFVDDWIEIDGKSGVLGQASLMMNFSRREIIDGDIFIFVAETDEAMGLNGEPIKLREGRLVADHPAMIELERTVLHELGHFFGLGHDFSGQDSIMSYDYSQPHISRTDMIGLWALYPFGLAPPAPAPVAPNP